MHSEDQKQILWRILCCLATVSPIFATQTSIPALNTTVTQFTEFQIPVQNTTNDDTIHNLKSENSPEIQVSNGITESKFNDSLISESTTRMPSIEYDMNSRMSGNSPVDQLTELSANQINMPSVDTTYGNNAIVSDGTDSTVIPVIMTVNSTYQNNLNDNISHENTKANNNETSIISNDSVQNYIKNSINLTTGAPTLDPKPKGVLGQMTQESHRNKRSFLRSSLHTNLDELLNMKRQRRATMRSKRNTNYDDLLASLLAAQDYKYNDNYDSYPDKSELNALAMNYILNAMNSGDSDNKNIDLDKLSQYYYENLLPLIDTIEPNSDTDSDEELIGQELPIIVQPLSQSVIPVIPYPNRYQRIRRSYYDRYRNPISVYTGLKRKRAHMRGEWGRIVGANSDRGTIEDEAQEANKIYSLATLLATGSTPDEHRLRYKRSVRRPFKPITLKNM